MLKPGGRLYIGNIPVSRKIHREAVNDISRWTGRIAGGLPEADLVRAVAQSGFEDVEIPHRHSVFEGVPNPSGALACGTIGISLRARKA